MKSLKITMGSVAALWALAALLSIPKAAFHLHDPQVGAFALCMLITAVSSLAAGVILSTFLFRSAFKPAA